MTSSLDNLRIFLWVGLGLLIWMCVQAWQADYAPARRSDLPTPSAETALDEPETADLPALPELEASPDTSAPLPGAPAPDVEPASSRIIRVRTDVLDVEINPVGGELQSAALIAYPEQKDKPDIPVTLLNRAPAERFVVQSGLRAAEGRPEANHRSPFTADRDVYELAAGDDELTVRLTWEDPAGIAVEKIYTFKRRRYDIGLSQVVTNAGQEPYQAVSYLRIQRRHDPPSRSYFNVDSYSFTGPVAFDGERYEKLDVDDLADEPYEASQQGAWIAAIQHHFLVAAVPASENAANYRAVYDGQQYTLSAIDAQLTTTEPGGKSEFAAKLFVGPKLQSQLRDTADGLALTVDYGKLTLLAQPLFWLLQKVFDIVGNWGWSIIIVTFLIKLVFYKLTETSGRSMAKMRKLQPRMKALQERYKDDREAMSRALMDIYKQEKVNPVAGCLPMLIQIPFFIAFYWVLLESVEMRQAPFMLWITDLSSRDPIFLLPLLMGGAMFLQQKLNPAPPDPVQAKVMMFLPVVFTGMFAFFPAGLVLYWLTNSVLSILQQWRINKVLGAD